MSAFELAVSGVDGIGVAARTGVDRIELCSGLELGGLTPSGAFIEAAVAGAGCPVHVLVRPRSGGFEYDADERAVILRDVRRAISAGAAGVVVGATRSDQVDTDLVTACVDLAPVTFHRAFDSLPDRRAALDLLAGLGVVRVLTSAGADSVVDALPRLASLVEHAAGRSEVMAGAGVTSANVAAVVATGVDAVHASAKRRVEDDGVRLGSAGGLARFVADEDEAHRIRDVIRSARQDGRAG